jgi:phosphate:Na+ symporter
MLRKILLSIILIILGYGFWISPDFKEISAGVAIFLFGMMFLEDGFKAFTGGVLEKVLKKSTDKLYKSVGFGILATSVMQSSSLVSILTISFLSAGLIGLSQGIGIVFGANLGTTTGAWLVAGYGLKIDIAAYAMPMLVFGVILIFQKSKSFKGFGYILAGLGFLFLGIHFMKEGFEAFKSTIDLASFGGTGIKYLFIFTGIGIFATVVMQSSHATLVLIITALAAGQISYENALALAIGANVGTTITAIIGAMSANIAGKRLAGAHLIFNLVTGLIAIIFINQIMFSVDYASNLFGIAPDNYTLKLAVFHTIFNIIGVVVMIPFINILVKFLESTMKDPVVLEDEKTVDTVRYLNDSVLELPETALVTIILETKHLFENAFDIICQGLNLDKTKILLTVPIEETINTQLNNPINIDDLYNRNIKGIYGDIIEFATKVQFHIPKEEVDDIYQIKLANRYLVEAVKDTKHLQKNLIKYSQSKNEHIKEQYYNIQKNLSEILRDIQNIDKTEEDTTIMLLVSKSKVHIEKNDILSNGTLDNLIRSSLITHEMATSLMNDSAYAYSIGKNLITFAEIIFIDKSSDINNMYDDIILSENEVDTFIEKELHHGIK